MSKFSILSFEFKESMLIALQALSANKIRSALTMLGIFIGITVVVLMSTAINGINNSFQKGISAMGSNVLYINKWTWFSNVPWWEMRNRRNLTMEDYSKFKALAKLPVAIAPAISTLQTIKFKQRTVNNVFVNGSNAEYIKTTNLTFAEGRFYSEMESKSARNVSVLGYKVAQDLFPHGNALDKYVKIGAVNFKVVGVLDKQGSFLLGSFNPDQRVYIPIGTVFKYFSSNRNKSISIDVRAASPAMVINTKAEANGIMRKVRGLTYNQKDDFGINQQEALIEAYNKRIGVIQIAGLFITGLALFVGAIGIMNIMFVSVKERTKEIGLRKAIGAKKRTILAQFLLESATICTIGGIIGLIAAILLSLLVNQFIPTSIQYSAVVIAIGVSLLTGIISGIAPAYTAAKMNPVDALRYE